MNYSSYNNYNGNNQNNIESIGAKDSINEDEIMDSGPVKGGTLKLFSTRPDTLNPILTRNVFVQDFTNLIYEGLFKLNREQQAVPVLADKWEVSEDGLIWTFHIRDNVYWHDSMPLTADDVNFTIETIQNNKVNSIYKKNIQNIAVFTVVNKSTFRIFLKKPDSFTKELMTFPIIPKHYFAGSDITRLNSKENMEPVGTGPYKYISGSGTDVIILEANENWWNSDNNENVELRLPYISTINIKIYNNEKDAIAAFQTSDIDVVPVQTGDFIKYTGRSDLLIRKYPGKNYEFIAFNLNNAVLADKTVRQAIALAIDRVKIINEVLPGDAVVSDIPVIPNTWLNDTNITAYIPDKRKARKLLENNGWNEDSKGILYKHEKGVRHTLKFELMINNYNQTREDVAKNVSEQLKEIGIELAIKKVNWEDEQKLLKSKKFDMVLIGYRIASIPDVSFAYSSIDAVAGFNVSGYSNPSVDFFLDQIRLTSDEQEKKSLFASMKKVIADEVPYIGLYFYNKAVLYNKRIRGELSPHVWDKYNDLARWYIPKGD